MDKQEKQTNISSDAKWYRQKIIEMVEHIENEDHLISIYSFAKVFFDD